MRLRTAEVMETAMSRFRSIEDAPLLGTQQATSPERLPVSSRDARRQYSSLMVAILSLAAASAAFAQPSDEILAVTRWKLNFTVTSTTSGSQNDFQGNSTWDFKAVATGSAILVPGTTRSYQGLTNITVSGNYTSKWILPGSTCYYETNTSFSGVPDRSGTRMAYVSMIRKDGYTIDPGPDTIQYKITTSEVCGGKTTVREGTESYYWTPVWPEPIPYPASGTFLSGQVKRKSQILIGQMPAYAPDGDFVLTYTMVPDVVEDLKLEVDDTGDYKNWRPEGKRDGSAGAPLQLTATLVSSTGKDPNGKISSMKWELKNTSKEPGVALNWPLNAADSEFDLKFDPFVKPGVTDENKQSIEHFEISGYSDSATILPYDWGAWADLVVTATLTDGRKFTGKLKTSGDSPVRLPRRAADSHIADIWKEQQQKKGVKLGADNADDESKPDGDGTPGDGLTLYEEYRGFYENGTHIEGDPAKKDYFVLNKVAALASGGIAKFQRISKLAVHGKLQPDELPADRVINKNNKQGSHIVDQHGVIIELDRSLVSLYKAFGGPGNPKMISHIGIPTDAGSVEAGYEAVNVAHELMHTVNTWHHGESDYEVVWWASPDGKLREITTTSPAIGNEIRVLNEDGTDATADVIINITGLVNGSLTWIGTKNGQHSGFENCVMRYDNSRTYIADADATIRYKVREPVGHASCSNPAGTGVNEPGRRPQSRYKEAAAGRGDCQHQLLVTDAVTAPQR